ncbi:MAG: competence protein ComG [Erysipelotrichaceae bacterium]|nr:competence protein ComG [Erysipelotrichaceae bacterium]
MHERLIAILKIALECNVTDIHFSFHEGNTKEIVIEMRVDGEVRRVRDQGDDERLLRYIMYRANLDLANVFEPQTGSFTETVNGRELSLRFALVCSYRMKSGVLRILNNHSALEIEDLCTDPHVTYWLQHLTDSRSGLYIFSGPTGSGKTTTLYTILSHTYGKKIYSLEDPIEVVQDSFVQLQVNDRQLTYADGIKQLMRQDPDIIFIGEIRDALAAEMAVRSALTGHLVLTSIHSADCTGAISRMLELGVNEYQLRDVLSGIANQRLFTLKDGSRTGVYEIMNRHEIRQYMNEHTLPEDHVSLKEKLHEACISGIVSKAEIEEETI